MTDTSKLAVVTGAGRGIGRVVTERLAERGFQVVAVGRSLEQLEAVAETTGALPLALDVSDATAVAEGWARIQRDHGAPALLVNNAGIAGPSARTWVQDPGDWWRVFEVNVLGAFLMCRAVLPAMIQAGGGRIVNLSSNAAFFPIEADSDAAVNSAYMASKAALIRFTEALAGETTHQGVRVFAISPGMVKTDMTQTVFADYWDEPDVWTPPEATADLVEFIASGALDGLSGRYIHASSDDWRALADTADEALAHDYYSLRVRTP